MAAGKEHWKQIVASWFGVPQPTDDASMRIAGLNQMGKQVGQHIIDVCPNETERTIALDKLRECVFWAGASIACNPQPPADDPRLVRPS